MKPAPCLISPLTLISVFLPTGCCATVTRPCRQLAAAPFCSPEKTGPLATTCSSYPSVVFQPNTDTVRRSAAGMSPGSRLRPLPECESTACERVP
jgi:hypothetical protein